MDKRRVRILWGKPFFYFFFSFIYIYIYIIYKAPIPSSPPPWLFRFSVIYRRRVEALPVAAEEPSFGPSPVVSRVEEGSPVFFSFAEFASMIRLWIDALHFTELFLSSFVHLVYGFYIFSSAVAGDLSQAFHRRFLFPSPKVENKHDFSTPTIPNPHTLPPIVLVHGIFGFGQGVSTPSFLSFLLPMLLCPS